MQTEARPRVTASLARTENYQGMCLSISAEIHAGDGHMPAGIRERLTQPDDGTLQAVIDVQDRVHAAYIQLDRVLSPEQSVELLKHCVDKLGFHLILPIAEWKVVLRSH